MASTMLQYISMHKQNIFEEHRQILLLPLNNLLAILKKHIGARRMD
jgi:hypothetical protein